MTIIATCGHEVLGEDAFKGYYWKQYGRECEPELSYGGLCPKCIPIYHAVEADSLEDAEVKLKDVEAVGLIDILEGTYGGKRTTKNVAGVDFEIYEVPPH